MNRRTLQVFLFAAFLGVSKAHHFIRLVILAGLGLAGLWMVHTLAQDFSHLNLGGHGGGGGGNSKELGDLKLYKRSIQDDSPKINWDYVLSRDPASCARSFICQLAAQDEKLLSKEEQTILDLTRNSANSDSWASKQLREALKYGEGMTSQSQCRKIYKICPYSSQTMMTLLKVFGA